MTLSLYIPQGNKTTMDGKLQKEFTCWPLLLKPGFQGHDGMGVPMVGERIRSGNKGGKVAQSFLGCILDHHTPTGGSLTSSPQHWELLGLPNGPVLV